MKHLLRSCVLLVLACFAACNSTPENTVTAPAVNSEESIEAKNVKTVKASMEALNQHNVDAMYKDVAPDAMDYGDGSMEPMRNSDSTRMMMKAWLDAIPDFRCENTEFYSEGNKVVVISDVSGTWKNNFMGMKASGKSFKFRDTDIFTLNNEGKITEHRSIQHMGPLMAGIGMSMPGEQK